MILYFVLRLLLFSQEKACDQVLCQLVTSKDLHQVNNDTTDGSESICQSTYVAKEVQRAIDCALVLHFVIVHPKRDLCKMFVV